MNATSALDPGQPESAPRGVKQRFRQGWNRLRGGTLSPGRAAASVGVGLFIACLPLFGGHLFLVLLVCLPLRLDAALAYLVAHISNPLTLPLFLWLELEIGSLLLRGRHTTLAFAEMQRLGVAGVTSQIAVGAVVAGVLFAGAGALATWLLAHRFQDARQRDLAEARRRTLARYAGASRPARSYVGIKLRTDPALGAIAALPGHFGRVVDAGCGYFQLGLCLLELGRIRTLVGIEADPVRVAEAEAAVAAAKSDARVQAGDLCTAPIPEADTVLFVDSLHYLPLAAQNAVLARAAAALAPEGRIIIREVDSGASNRSAFTELLERRAARKRGRRQALEFRSSQELSETLEALGLESNVVQHDELSLVHNALVVARKRS